MHTELQILEFKKKTQTYWGKLWKIVEIHYHDHACSRLGLTCSLAPVPTLSSNITVPWHWRHSDVTARRKKPESDWELVMPWCQSQQSQQSLNAKVCEKWSPVIDLYKNASVHLFRHSQYDAAIFTAAASRCQGHSHNTRGGGFYGGLNGVIKEWKKYFWTLRREVTGAVDERVTVSVKRRGSAHRQEITEQDWSFSWVWTDSVLIQMDLPRVSAFGELPFG